MRHVPSTDKQGQPESDTPQDGDGKSLHALSSSHSTFAAPE
jgi:hypothetical protein